MASDASQPPDDSTVASRWQPISSIYRRIAGVLVEKAKTTPDAYPLSLNALTAGCNQKSNRSPQMNLTAEQAEEALEKLRYLGAISEVHGGGRVPKYRHYMKDWLGVDGSELAVMAELLLRGEQTVGELRSRAARMAPIPDVTALQPILESLIDKGLVVALTPEGRGQVVGHTLYEQREMEQLKARYATVNRRAEPAGERSTARQARADSAAQAGPTQRDAAAPSASGPLPNEVEGEVAVLKQEVSQLKDELARLRREIDDLWSNLR